MSNEEKLTKVGINWYPGHMIKAKRDIIQKLDLIDIVFEVIDARIPYSSKNKDIDNIIKNKKRILVFTKKDLCDMKLTEKWVNYYKKLGYEIVLLDLINGDIKELLKLTDKISIEINNTRAKKGLKPRKTRILILGIPNVGKSTLINKLVGKKSTKVGNTPGVTTHLEWIRVGEKFELLDTPGILWPKLDDNEVALNLASMTAIKEEVLNLEDIAVHILKKLLNNYPKEVTERYKINQNDDIITSLDKIGKKIGAVRNNEVDYEKVYKFILKDLREGRLGKITFDII